MDLRRHVVNNSHAVSPLKETQSNMATDESGSLGKKDVIFGAGYLNPERSHDDTDGVSLCSVYEPPAHLGCVSCGSALISRGYPWRLFRPRPFGHNITSTGVFK